MSGRRFEVGHEVSEAYVLSEMSGRRFEVRQRANGVCVILTRLVSSVGRASDLKSEGRVFKSCSRHSTIANVVQW